MKELGNRAEELEQGQRSSQELAAFMDDLREVVRQVENQLSEDGEERQG